MSRLTDSQKREIHYSIYEQLVAEERITLTNMSKNLGLARNTVTSHFNYMMEHEILLPPSLRLKMFEDLREYVYLMNFEKPVRVYQELENNPRIVYHNLTSGAFNMVAITDSPVDFESHPHFKECILQGPRNDCLYTHVSRDTYEDAFGEIKKTLEEGNLTCGMLPIEHVPRTIIWTELEWKLFYDLKHNVRRTFTEIVKNHGISKYLFYQSYERIKKNCIKIVSFFPEKRLNYSDFYFIFKTDYEKSLIDLFTLLPCSNMFCHVGDCTVAWINIPRTFSFKEFFGLLYWMDDHEIVKDIMYALAFFTPPGPAKRKAKSFFSP